MRIASLMRSRWVPGCMPASMLPSQSRLRDEAVRGHKMATDCSVQISGPVDDAPKAIQRHLQRVISRWHDSGARTLIPIG